MKQGDDYRLWIDLPKSLSRFIVSKGSVCIDGVSLTVAGESPRGFWVALIPTTLELTTLAALKPGDPVNIEVDVIAKMVSSWVERALAQRPGRSKPRRRVR